MPRCSVLAMVALAAAVGPTQERRVTLAECLRLALRQNHLLQANRYGAMEAAMQVPLAESAFDPVFTGNAAYVDAETPTASALESTRFGVGAGGGFAGNLGPTFPRGGGGPRAAVPKRRSYSLDLSLTKRFLTGLTAQASYNFQWFKTNQFFALINPSYTHSVRFSLTQPLLRGGWLTANAAPVAVARNSAWSARENLRAAWEELVFNVLQTYWDLVYAEEDLAVKEQSLRLAQVLERDNLEKLKAGTMTPLDVIQARVEIKNRSIEVRRARTVLENTRDQLRRLVDPEGMAARPGVRWVPVDRPLLREARPPRLVAALADAFRYRADWRQAELALENARLEEARQRNALLPQLDLSTALQYRGVGANAPDPFQDVWRRRFDTWTFGLTFALPLGNRAARAAYLQAVLARRRAEANLEELRSQIHVEIRSALREVETALDTITQTRQALQFAREQLKGELTKLEVGRSTSYQVLLVQEDWAQARINERRALLDTMIARARLERAKGTLLVYVGLVTPRGLLARP